MTRLRVLLVIMFASLGLLVAGCASYRFANSENVTVERTGESIVKYSGVINEHGLKKLARVIGPDDTLYLFSPGGFVHLIGDYVHLIVSNGVHIRIETCVSSCAIIALYGKTVKSAGRFNGKLGFHAPSSVLRDISPGFAEFISSSATDELADHIRGAGYNEELVRLMAETPHADISWVHTNDLGLYKK